MGHCPGAIRGADAAGYVKGTWMNAETTHIGRSLPRLEDEIFITGKSRYTDDIVREGDIWRVTTEAAETNNVRTAIEDAGLEVTSVDLTMLPQNHIELDNVGDAKQVLKVIDALDDHDDVQGVYANFDVPDSVMAELAAD